MRYIIFKLGGEDYGIAVDHIREVLKSPELTPLPQTPAFIEGAIYLRGHHVAVMDLRKRFGVAVSGENTGLHILMIKVRNIVLGMRVDCVLDIFDIPNTVIEKPEHLGKEFMDAEVYLGMAHINGRDILILNVEAILEPQHCQELRDANP